MLIRARTTLDDGAIADVLEPTVRAGEVFALPRDLARADILAFWAAPANAVFIAERDGEVVGTSFVRANARGGGAHVANAGYATSAQARGRGVASALCEHSLAYARACGFTAIQFNYVVSTNTRAVALWQRHGLAIVGTLPRAFIHPTHGPVDVHVMFRAL